MSRAVRMINLGVAAILVAATAACVPPPSGGGGTVPPTVTEGYSGLDEAAGVRFRGPSTGKEIFLGTDLGGGVRNEAEYAWSDGTFPVTFSFDATENRITTTVDGSGGPVTVEYDFDTEVAPDCGTSGWNTLDILVVDRLATGDLRFDDVMVDSFPLGDFASSTPTASTWLNWTVSGFDFSRSFAVTGDIVATGWTGGEQSKVQLTVGCV